MKIAAAANKMTTDSNVKKNTLEQKPNGAFFCAMTRNQVKPSASSFDFQVHFKEINQGCSLVFSTSLPIGQILNF